MKFKKFGKLPGRPSKLIELALKDLEKVERSKKYKVDMDLWHQPNGKCSVCFAGAVMAKTMKLARAKHGNPYTFSKEKPALLALNNLREGDVTIAFSRLGLFGPNGTGFNCGITSYEIDKKKFKKEMRELALDLKEGGY